MNELAKVEVYKKKLSGICEENELIYRFKCDSYPITLTVQTVESPQVVMFEEDDEGEENRPDARLVFAYRDGELMYRISETFTIGDALFNKLKNLFKNMHSLWLQHFYRDILEHKYLSEEQMPVLSDDDGADIGEIFSELSESMEPVESFDDDEYEYDESDDD